MSSRLWPSMTDETKSVTVIAAECAPALYEKANEMCQRCRMKLILLHERNNIKSLHFVPSRLPTNMTIVSSKSIFLSSLTLSTLVAVSCSAWWGKNETITPEKYNPSGTWIVVVAVDDGFHLACYSVDQPLTRLQTNKTKSTQSPVSWNLMARSIGLGNQCVSAWLPRTNILLLLWRLIARESSRQSLSKFQCLLQFLHFLVSTRRIHFY